MNSIVDHLTAFPLPLWDKALRMAVVYLALVIGLRLAGRRELAQLNAFDLVVLLLLSNTVQNAVIGPDDSLLGGLFSAGVLLLLNAVVNRVLYRYPLIDRIVEGPPILLIVKGKTIEKNMRHEEITESELLAAVRRQGFYSFEEIDECILETNGSLTFIPKAKDGLEKEFAALRKELVELRRLIEARGRE